MRILITGACGFVGSALAENLFARMANLSIVGVDNLTRPGSESNRVRMAKMGVEFVHCDVRSRADFDALPPTEWVIDAAANPSVVAAINGFATRQLIEHNLIGSVNVLEYCRTHAAGLILLSSSRVYSISELRNLPIKLDTNAFALDTSEPVPLGVSVKGINTGFSTAAPISLYGSTKLASEVLALEYGSAFGFPVWINRCGVMAGAGQFGTPEQGIFSYWLNSHLRRRKLRYIGFGGTGHQSRDAFHPRDLADLLLAQIRTAGTTCPRIYTAGGGGQNAISLAQLTAWCDSRFGSHSPDADTSTRLYDVPWVIMDNSEAERDFGWKPQTSLFGILNEIADHAERHPEWLELSGVTAGP